MSTELDRIELGRLARFGSFFDRPDQATASYHKAYSLWLPILLVAALAGGVFWFNHDRGRAENESAEPATAAIEAPAPPASAVSPNSPTLGVSSTTSAWPDKSVTTADAPTQATEPPAVSGVSISSQYWRRGGLGSKAIVTLTLRNNNDYPVRDIELLCSFARRDGSHLTDRKRVIPDTVNMKGRKTIENMLVGFVNINASRAKCTAVAANRN
jgi:hypothetical protein